MQKLLSIDQVPINLFHIAAESKGFVKWQFLNDGVSNPPGFLQVIMVNPRVNIRIDILISHK